MALADEAVHWRVWWQVVVHAESVTQPRDRKIAAYVLARLVAAAGDAVGTIALPFLVLAAGRTAPDIGIVLGARTLPYLLVPALGAVLALWSRPLTMLGCNLLRSLSQVLSVVAVTHFHAFAGLLLLQFLVGTASALYGPAAGAVVPLLFKKDSMARANAFFSSSNTIIVLGASAIGGVLVGLLGPARTLLIDAGAYGVGALAIIPMW